MLILRALASLCTAPPCFSHIISYHISIGLIQILLAYFLDIMLGDPQWPYHPVRLIGTSIGKWESLLRRLPLYERISGILLTTIIVSSTYFISLAALHISRYGCVLWEAFTGATIIYFSIAIKSLADAAKKVMTALKEHDLIKARKALSMIVGRDTAHLNEEHIIRACVETIAEGSVDGILSPLFYSFIGGPGAAMAYRAVNTLDSMVGYKNESYIRFGWASARLDDVANYIPARISALLIPVAALLCGYSFKNSLKIACRDGRKHESPNSGIPEAAMAGALSVQLGGPSAYQAEIIEKPFIGDAINKLTVKSIEAAVRIVHVTTLLFLISGIGIIVCLNIL